jgi:hypothetical protein
MEARRLVGSVVLALVPVGLGALLLSPSVREPLGRTLAVIAGDWFGGEAGTVAYAVAAAADVRPGDPVFRADRPAGFRPVAHVASVEEGRLRLRFAPGAEVVREGRLTVVPPSRGLAEALAAALPAEAAEALGRSLSARLGALLEGAVLPDLERRLPDFLAEIDPRTDPAARRVLDAVRASLARHLAPLADELAGEVFRAVGAHFDFLDRMGLLWKLVWGDAEGLRGELEPVALGAAKAWWERRQDAVLTAIGEAFAAEAEAIEAWLREEVLVAARTRLAEPLLAGQRARLEREAEVALREVVDTVVLAPGGGLRVRFAAVVRTAILGKRGALLLLEPGP